MAQTGTGKTAAFAIPIIDRIHRSKRSLPGLQCIVMVPTRELAGQIGTVFNTLCHHTRVNPFAIYGGVDQDRQIARLKDGIDILVATPGRMFDLISQGAITVSQVNTLVLDEADRMLDQGFIKDIQSIKKNCPSDTRPCFFPPPLTKKSKNWRFPR